jgi:uncharacterized protein
MKRKLLFLSALFIAFFAVVSETTAQSSKSKTNDSGILYKITGKNLKKPSYLLGTFHLLCEKDLFPKEKIQSYVKQTEKLMLEIDLNDPAVMQKATQGAMLTGGKTAKDYLKTEDYARVDALFKNYLGISYDQLQTFKPFMASTVLMMSPKIIGCQASPGYDKILADAATADKMPVVGLETVEDEYAAIDAQPLEKQFESLNKVAANPEKSIADFKNLYRVYLTQNLGGIYKILDDQMKEDQGSKEKLLDERNAKWVPVIEKNIALTPSFIAVGAGHLGGEKGVINLLRKKGYKLTPIKI